MAATAQLHTPGDLAKILGGDFTHEKVLRFARRKGWPHRRLGRFDVRFTDEDVAEILRRTRVENAAKTTTAGAPGLTGRSAARQRTKRGP